MAGESPIIPKAWAGSWPPSSTPSRSTAGTGRQEGGRQAGLSCSGAAEARDQDAAGAGVSLVAADGRAQLRDRMAESWRRAMRGDGVMPSMVMEWNALVLERPARNQRRTPWRLGIQGMPRRTAWPSQLGSMMPVVGCACGCWSECASEDSGAFATGQEWLHGGADEGSDSAGTGARDARDNGARDGVPCGRYVRADHAAAGDEGAPLLEFRFATPAVFVLQLSLVASAIALADRPVQQPSSYWLPGVEQGFE